MHCDHFYDTVQYRYILNLNVADYFDSVWITAYDESAEVLMGLSAQQFAAMKEEEIQ
jgi:replication factor A1